jgi:hypothetical protein
MAKKKEAVRQPQARASATDVRLTAEPGAILLLAMIAATRWG